MGAVTAAGIPWDHTERATYYQARMDEIAKTIPPMYIAPTFDEAVYRKLYLQLCRWDSARVERDKALKLAQLPYPTATGIPQHVTALTNILLP